MVVATASTNAFVDVFWKFRGVARSTLLADGLVPLRFTYERQSNSLTESTWLDFDQSKRRAKSTYFKGDKRRDYAIEASGVTDPITAVLHARAAGLEPGGEVRYTIFTGESSYLVQLRAVGEEEITVPAGRFAALKLQPEVWKLRATAEPDQRLRQATIWISRDPTHVILRIRSEVFVGAVSLDLVELGVPS